MEKRNKIEMLCVMKFDAIIMICIIAFTCHSNDVHYLNCHNFMFIQWFYWPIFLLNIVCRVWPTRWMVPESYWWVRVAESHWFPSYRIMICGWHHSPNKQTNDLFWQEWQLTGNSQRPGWVCSFPYTLYPYMETFTLIMVAWLFRLLVLCWFGILSTPQRSPFIWSSADIPNHVRPFGSNWGVMCMLSLWRTINLARVCYSS